MKPLVNAFSLVEVLITIAIIIVLSGVAVTGYSMFMENSYNASISKSLQELENGLTEYQESNKLYPIPDGNRIYYGHVGEYKTPNYDEDVYGVSGFLTQKTLSNFTTKTFPLDPRNHQYYGYGILQNQKYFQLAGVIIENDSPLSVVKGNYSTPDGESMENIVKEFAGPEFVSHNSDAYFPYNPEENLMVARIDAMSGQVLINGKEYDEPTTKSTLLMEGDRLIVATGGTLTLHYSDGSQSELGMPEAMTDITFASMRYLQENNLATKIRIALNFGKILNKVAKLTSGSEFEIYTNNTIASVRGTIFSVTYSGSAIIEVQQGSVEVRTIETPPSPETFFQEIEEKGLTLGTPITTPISSISQKDGKSFIEVPPASPKKGCQISETGIKDIQNPSPTSESLANTPNSRNQSSTNPTPPDPTSGTTEDEDPETPETTQSGTLIHGICGDENGKYFDLESELSQFCKSGNKTDFQSTISGWTWNCNGENGGTSSFCSAIKANYLWTSSDTRSACSSRCNGTQSKTIICIKSDGTQVNDTKCQQSVRTNPETRGCNIGTCSGRGCNDCPNGYIDSSHNRAREKCGPCVVGKCLGGQKSERYCAGVKDALGRDVICAREKAGLFNCRGWDMYSWEGNAIR